MPLLPDLGTDNNYTKDWSHKELIIYASYTYFIILCYVILIIFAFMNLMQLIVQRGRCNVSHPLFVTYCLLILTLLFSIVYSVLQIKINEDDAYALVMFYLSPVCFKSMLGLEQIWMMLLLAMRINQELQETRKMSSARNNQRQSKIMCGSITIFILQLILFLANVISIILIMVLRVDEIRTTVFKVNSAFWGSTQFCLFFGLIISVIVLLKRLNAKEH